MGGRTGSEFYWNVDFKGSIWPESPLESMIRIWEQPQTETYAWPAETEEFIQRSL